jgi:uncharacterized protein (DUF302 family)
MQEGTMNYGFHPTTKGPFEAAAHRVLDALRAEGFGILSDIDIQTSPHPRRVQPAAGPQGTPS